MAPTRPQQADGRQSAQCRGGADYVVIVGAGVAELVGCRGHPPTRTGAAGVAGQCLSRPGVSKPAISDGAGDGQTAG